jgi:hypothetical protein
MYVHGLRPRVEVDQVLLDLADTTNGRFKHSLNEDALLRLYHLVVTLFKLPVDFDVLDVEACEVLEFLIFHPGLAILPISVKHYELLTSIPCSFFSAGTCSTLT